MALTPFTIKPAVGAKTTSKRVGRGNGSQKGTTAARGGKGQTARSGGGKRTQIRAFKNQLLKTPKLRGFKSIYQKSAVITLSRISKFFKDNEEVNPKILKRKGLVPDSAKEVKILVAGELDKKLTFTGCIASKKAAEMIEKAGGKLVY